MIALERFSSLSAVPGLAHGVTTRAGGASRGSYASLNLGRGSGDDRAAVDENRRRVAKALGVPGPIRFGHQVHGIAVAVVGPGDESASTGDADAVATCSPGVAVGVLGADCPGVLLVDPERRALAVVHSGWRGTLGGAVPAAIDTLRARFGTDPASLRAGIGPGISCARYEVGPEVASAFRAGFEGAADCLTPGRGDRWHLDLHAALARQLVRSGVPADHVETMSACTYRDGDRFFSHRRDGAQTGRHALVAAWL